MDYNNIINSIVSNITFNDTKKYIRIINKKKINQLNNLIFNETFENIIIMSYEITFLNAAKQVYYCSKQLIFKNNQFDTLSEIIYSDPEMSNIYLINSYTNDDLYISLYH